VRGTQAFRRSHNICMKCHNKLAHNRIIKRQQVNPVA
jgi:hypothetical protein